MPPDSHSGDPFKWISFVVVAFMFINVVLVERVGEMEEMSTPMVLVKTAEDVGGVTPPFLFFAYLREPGLSGLRIENYLRCGITHLIFAGISIDSKTSRLVLPGGNFLEELAVIRQTTRKFPWKIKVLLSIGGPGDKSGGFLRMVQSASRRTQFVQEVRKMVVDYDLDGLDYYWERPPTEGAYRLFGELVSETRHYMRRNKSAVSSLSTTLHTRRVVMFTSDGNMYDPNNEFLLTISAFPSVTVSTFLARYNFLDHVDYVHWRTYESYLRNVRDLLSPSYLNTLNEPSWKRKLIMGIPYFAQSVDGDHELGRLPFHRLFLHLEEDPWEMFLQDDFGEDGETPLERAMMVPDADGRTDTPQTGYYNYVSIWDVVRKVRVARESGVGGIFASDITHDIHPPSEYSITFTIGRELGHWVRTLVTFSQT